jgi:prepilin-type N-terminal cleavage/methylation domain-containing protein
MDYLTLGISRPRGRCAARARMKVFPRGFTLIELMVVVALIGILAAVIGFSISGGSQATALENAQRNLMAMIQAAKANAVLEGGPARLIIYADTNAAEANAETTGTIAPKLLRFYGVIYGQTSGNGNTTWVAANQGAYLPTGIYFLPAASSSFANNLVPKTDTNNALTSKSGSTSGYGTMNLAQFPSNQPQSAGSGDTYYYVEFTPDGVFRGTGNNALANILLAAARPISDTAVDFGGQPPPGGQVNQLVSGVQIRFLGFAPFTGIADITGQQ